MAEELAQLKIGFALDSSQLDKGMGHVLSNLNLMQKEFKASMIGVDKYEKTLEDLAMEKKGLAKILDQQKIALASIQNAYDETTQSLKKNEQNVKDLKKRYDEAKNSKNMDEKALKDLEKEYQRAVSAKKKDEKALQTLHAKYIDMSTQVKKTEMDIDKVNKTIEEQPTAFDKMRGGIKKTSSVLLETGGHMTKFTTKLAVMGVKAAATGVALATAFSGAVLKNAMDMADSVGDLQIKLGISEQEAQKLQSTAKELNRQGWGDMSELTNDLAIIRQQMKDLSEKDLKDFTKANSLMTQKFGTDTNEVTRTIKVMMKNLGVSSEEATDILIAGFQGGLDSTGKTFAA